MANFNRQSTTPPGSPSKSIMTELMDPKSPMNSPVYSCEIPIIKAVTKWPARGSPIALLIKEPVCDSSISRVTRSFSRNVSHLPRPVSSSHTNVNNSSGPHLSSRNVSNLPRPVSSSRTNLGTQIEDPTPFNDTKVPTSKSRLTFGPSSRHHYNTQTAASTARRTLSDSPGSALSSLPCTENMKSSRLQTSPKKPSAPASSRRSQLGKLPYSLSSPNINNLSISNENTPPVPFAPRCELHERIMRGSASDNNYYPHPLYSNPTVASSPLTASASSTDISQPRSNDQKNTERNVSRIPSPTSRSKSRAFSRRHLVSPVRRAIVKGEESQARRNVPMFWGSQQIHPGMNSPPGYTPEPQVESASLPKSKTFGVFATLKNSSSIQWLNNSRPASNPNRTTEPTISTTNCSPIPEFTTNILQVHSAQSPTYWCGRFQSVWDRLMTDDFNACVFNLLPLDDDSKCEKASEHYRRGGKTLTQTSSPLKSDPPTPLLEKSRKKTPAKSHKTVITVSSPAAAAVLLLEDFDKRAQKVMVFLATMCCTSPAKKSLREWQIQYAKAMKNKALMPKSDPDEKGFFGRMGRVISDGVTGNKNGTNGRITVMGKRSAFGLRRGGKSAAGDQ